jgi:hypothetical protein
MTGNGTRGAASRDGGAAMGGAAGSTSSHRSYG